MSKDKLFTIELDDINSVPVIQYKGEVINNLVDVKFNWHTKDDKGNGKCEIKLEYFNDSVNGIPVNVGVKHTKKDYVKLEQVLHGNGDSAELGKRIDVDEL